MDTALPHWLCVRSGGRRTSRARERWVPLENCNYARGNPKSEIHLDVAEAKMGKNKWYFRSFSRLAHIASSFPLIGHTHTESIIHFGRNGWKCRPTNAHRLPFDRSAVDARKLNAQRYGSTASIRPTRRVALWILWIRILFQTLAKSCVCVRDAIQPMCAMSETAWLALSPWYDYKNVCQISGSARSRLSGVHLMRRLLLLSFHFSDNYLRCAHSVFIIQTSRWMP